MEEKTINKFGSNNLLIINNGIDSRNVLIKEELIIEEDPSLINFSELQTTNETNRLTSKTKQKETVKYIRRKKVGRSPDWWTVTLIYCPKCKTTRNKKCREKFKTCEDCLTQYTYQCSNCLKRYDKLSGVRDHINLRCKNKQKKYKHFENKIEGDKIKNKCSRCFKKFSEESEKFEHEKHCVDELGLKCGYCMYKAQNNRYLRLHIREHHAELFKVRYQKYAAMMCAHCNYKTFKKYLLIDHIMDRHNPDKIHNDRKINDPKPTPALIRPINSIQILPVVNFIQPRFITILPQLG